MVHQTLALWISVVAAAAAVTGIYAVWRMDEQRLILTGLRRVLGHRPHDMLIAGRHGRGVGFNFAIDRLAVCWDGGAWGLVFRFDELSGAELEIDGRLAARVHRGEPRYGVEPACEAAAQVSLRLVFEDPHYPDFILDLWTAQDALGEDGVTAKEAVRQGRLWIDRFASLLRRPVLRRKAAMAAWKDEQRPPGSLRTPAAV